MSVNFHVGFFYGVELKIITSEDYQKICELSEDLELSNNKLQIRNFSPMISPSRYFLYIEETLERYSEDGNNVIKQIAFNESHYEYDVSIVDYCYTNDLDREFFLPRWFFYTEFS